MRNCILLQFEVPRRAVGLDRAPSPPSGSIGRFYSKSGVFHLFTPNRARIGKSSWNRALGMNRSKSGVICNIICMLWYACMHAYTCNLDRLHACDRDRSRLYYTCVHRKNCMHLNIWIKAFIRSTQRLATVRCFNVFCLCYLKNQTCLPTWQKEIQILRVTVQCASSHFRRAGC
jgi:hypothetical protein